MHLNWNKTFYLNCPCQLYGFIYHRMHNWAPHRLVYLKVYVDMENLFFCFVHAIYSSKKDAPCYAWPVHWKEALTMTELSLLCIFIIRNSLLADSSFVFLAYALNYFLPIPMSCVTWRVFFFWRTDCMDKTKIKINFPYQYTLLNIPYNGGLNCASDDI